MDKWIRVQDNWLLAQRWDQDEPDQEPRPQHNNILIRVPHLLGQTPVFLPTRKRASVKILASPWGIVCFPSGKALTTAHEDLFLMIIHTVSIQPDGKMTKMVMRNPLLDDLLNTRVIISRIVKGKPQELWNERLLRAREQQGKKIQVEIDPRWTRPRSSSLIDPRVRNNLKFTGKALYCFIACHTVKSQMSYEKLKQAISPCSRMNNFRIAVEEQFNRLTSMGIIKREDFISLEGEESVRWTRKKYELSSKKQGLSSQKQHLSSKLTKIRLVTS